MGTKRCAKQRASRIDRCRLSGDPAGGAADPYGAGARQALWPARHRRSRQALQQHGQGSAQQDRGLVSYLLGNPSQQRIFRDVQSYQPTLTALNQVDADAITFETCSSGTGDLKAIGEIIKDKKVVIGVIDHHTLQVERPDQVADLIREALKYIPPERLVISSDCGMGREGMSRRHAAYKMVAMVLGTNIVRKELGLPEAECLAADPRFSLARTR